MRRLDLIFQCPFFKGTTEYDNLMKEIDEFVKKEAHTEYEILNLNYTYVLTDEKTIYPANMYKLQIKLDYPNEFNLNDMQQYENMIVENIRKIVWEVH